MKRRILFLAILFLLISGSTFAQPEYKKGSDKVKYEKELRAYLQLRNISAEETEIYVSNILNATNPLPSDKLKGGSSVILDSSGCLNSDFELTATGTYTAANSIPGWKLSYRTITNCNSLAAWQPGSPEFYIVSTPFFFQNLVLPQSPLGGTKVAQLNNTNPSYYETMLTKSIAVTASNYKFVYAFAGVLNDGSHMCCEQPNLKIRINNSVCGEYFAGTPGSSCPTSVAKGFASYNNGHLYYSSWQVDTLNLFPYIGLTIDINFIASDCIFGGHFGSMFVDTQCSDSPSECDKINFPGNSSVSFCQGSSTAVIHGVPNTGFSTYQWISPTGTLSAQQATNSVLTITNPVAGSVYTLQLGAAGFCGGLMATYTLVFTQTSIKCLETSPSCNSNPSGSATITARGSGGGYQYSWASSTQTTTGTNSIVTGLAPGVYTVNVSAANSVGCGSAAAVFTITGFNGAAPAVSINPVSAHICVGQQASLNAQGSATSFTWSGGGNASGIIVSPVSPTYYTLTAGNSGMPCTSTITALVKVSSVKLTATASKTAVCPGDVITLTASGTQSYYWNYVPGSAIYTIAPVSNTVFIVTGSSVFSGITCSDSQTITLNLRQAPYVFVTGAPSICQGDSSTYIGGGASIYTWHTGEVKPSISFTTPVAGLYSVCVTGVDPGGCIGKYCLPVEVGLCTGLSENNIANEFLVYPNPSHGEIIIELKRPFEFIIYNELMQVVCISKSGPDNSLQTPVRLSSGFYFVCVTGYPPKKVIID